MKRLLSIFLLFACLLPARAQQIIKATISITNAPTTNGQTLVVNAVTRWWTNDTTLNPAIYVATNSTAAGSLTNLYNQIAAYPYAGSLILSYVNSTNLSLVSQLNGALAVTAAGGWASVGLSTQTVTILEVIRVPFTSIPNATNRTNQASLLVAGLDTFSTNAFSAGANALSNHVNLTAAQTISGAKTYTGANLYSNANQMFSGGTISNANAFITGGKFSNGVFHSFISTNGQNFGNAFISQSATAGEQFGQNATAIQGGTALGISATASGTNSTAVGNSSTASGYQSSAYGHLTLASGRFSTALGEQANATQTNAVALGVGAFASGHSSVAIGFAASATHSNSTVIGYGAASTAADQVLIGTTGQILQIGGGISGNITNLTNGTLWSSVLNGTRSTNIIGITGSNAFIVNLNGTNGTLTGITSTNGTFNGTNTWGGDIAFTRFDVSTLANGNNLAVPFGTNVFIRLAPGSLTASPTIAGIVGGATTGGRNGQMFKVLNDTGYSVVWANTTVDPTPANRINTQDGADLTVVNKSVTTLIWDGNASRWRIAGVYPQTATATNAVAQTSGNATNLTVYTALSNNIPLTVIGTTGQTNNLFEIRDVNANKIVYIDTNGFFLGTNSYFAKAFSTNQTATNLFTFTLPPDSVIYFSAQITAYTTNGSNSAFYFREAGFKRPASGVATAVGIIGTQTVEDTPATAWDAAWSASVSNAVLNVTGGNLTTNVMWYGWIKLRGLPMVPFGP